MLKKLLPYLFFWILLFPASLQAKHGFDETVHMKLPQSKVSKWKMGHQKYKKNGTTITHYFLDNESKERWTKMINIQFKDKVHLKGARAEEFMQQEAKRSSQQVKSQVHHQDEDDILYERQFPSGEHELVRIIITDKGIHRVAFVKKSALTQEERAEWKERLLDAHTGGRPDAKKETKKKKKKAKKSKKESPAKKKPQPKKKKIIKKKPPKEEPQEEESQEEESSEEEIDLEEVEVEESEESHTEEEKAEPDEEEASD